MTISRQNLSIVVVSYMSDQVIHNCIDSIPSDIQIIVVDNSSSQKFKENIEKKYDNVQCILSPRNLGMGPGNNLGLKYTKTDFAFIINPDVILEETTIDEIIYASKELKSFAVLAPILNDENYPNYQLYQKKDILSESKVPFRVKSVDGFALVLNLKKLNQLKNFKNFNYFDENFFLSLFKNKYNKYLNNADKKIGVPLKNAYMKP